MKRGDEAVRRRRMLEAGRTVFVAEFRTGIGGAAQP